MKLSGTEIKTQELNETKIQMKMNQIIKGISLLSLLTRYCCLDLMLRKYFLPKRLEYFLNYFPFLANCFSLFVFSHSLEREKA